MKGSDDWPEGIAIVLVIFGFVVSLLTINSLLNYMVVFVAGAIFGNLYYKQRKRWKNPAALAGLGFLIGFTLGNFYGNLGKVLVLFALGAWGTYYLHKEKYIKTK